MISTFHFSFLDRADVSAWSLACPAIPPGNSHFTAHTRYFWLRCTLLVGAPDFNELDKFIFF